MENSKEQPEFVPQEFVFFEQTDFFEGIVQSAELASIPASIILEEETPKFDPSKYQIIWSQK